MDRRQFNKTVIASAIGASFLPAADAKADHPVFNTLPTGKGPLSAEDLVGEATLMQGEHIFGGLINGKSPTAVFYYPCQPVYDWLYRLNYECVLQKKKSAHCGFSHQPLHNPTHKNWHKNAIDFVWTDHWHFQNQTTVHEKIPPFGEPRFKIIFMWDNWNNFMSWVPNSHQVGGNEPPRMADVMLYHTVNEMPVHNGFISMCEGRPWKWKSNSNRNRGSGYRIQTFKTMPYPATISQYGYIRPPTRNMAN